MAVVYTDYTCQEIYIAAMLSQDPKMIEAINSGDPYMYFAKATGLAPPDATKYTHADLRNKTQAIHAWCQLRHDGQRHCQQGRD